MYGNCYYCQQELQNGQSTPHSLSDVQVHLLKLKTFVRRSDIREMTRCDRCSRQMKESRDLEGNGDSMRVLSELCSLGL